MKVMMKASGPPSLLMHRPSSNRFNFSSSSSSSLKLPQSCLSFSVSRPLHLRRNTSLLLTKNGDLDTWEHRRDLVFNMRVVVEILTGKLFYVIVDANATVLDLKKKIGAQEKLPDERLILLLYNDLMNENEASLLNYGVKDGSHLYLFFNSLNDCPAHQFL